MSSTDGGTGCSKDEYQRRAETVGPRSVFAIVVTYLAPECLRACLASLDAQERRVDAVCVVDNGGSREVATYVEELQRHVPTELLLPGENVGPAGAFALGLERFLATDHDFAWLMDDDIQPASSCLAALEKTIDARGRSVLVAPVLFERLTGERTDIWGWHGTLIPRRYVEQAGVPRADLFWGFEDTEYLHYRPPAHGYHAILEDAAEALISTRRADAAWASWKYYYLGRNGVFLNLYQRPGIAFLSRLKRLVRRLWAIELRVRQDPRDRARKRWLVAKGALDGARKRLGRTVVPDDPDRPLT